jgi:GMP synthase-like glutamine amidotransferase
VSDRALILQHGQLGPAGLLGEWCAERGIEVVVHRADGDDACPDPRDFAFVACLGSRFGPQDAEEPSVVSGRTCLERAVDQDVPVLGLCFGGQLLAHILGAEIRALETPELGWRTIETDDPDAIPAGPWLQWHWYGFTTPPGAEEIARSATGSQAFRSGPHLGVQFHPESTIEIVSRWAESDAGRLADLGIADGRALLEEHRDRADEAARNARTLFDGFLARARTTRRETHGAP